MVIGQSIPSKLSPRACYRFHFCSKLRRIWICWQLNINLFYFFISLRSLYIAEQAQTGFTRLLAASLAMTFFLSAFVNIGMVTGLLPVVGIPLPLVSYGEQLWLPSCKFWHPDVNQFTPHFI